MRAADKNKLTVKIYPRCSNCRHQCHRSAHQGCHLISARGVVIFSKALNFANTILQIVAKGKGANSRTAFYKRNNRWTEGLISAAKAVASSTNMLIETADGVISGRNKLEQMYIHTLCLGNVLGALIFLGPGLWLPMMWQRPRRNWWPLRVSKPITCQNPRIVSKPHPGLLRRLASRLCARLKTSLQPGIVRRVKK